MVWVLVGVVVILLFVGIGIYNGLVRQRQNVNQGVADIDAQLRQRHDLVPNLVETVRGYATHERETLDAVIQARNKAAQGSVNSGDEAQLRVSLDRLIAVAEAYPDLKADDNFRQLQDELSAIEGELQSARRYYNATVRDLNTGIQSFPDVLFARPLGFTEAEFYADADASIQQAPKVQFGAAGA